MEKDYNGIKYKINYLGISKNSEWDCFNWSVNINGQVFEYHTGLGHAIDLYEKNCVWRLTKTDKENLIDKSLEKRVFIPSIESVLECLFSDSQCGHELYQDFCDNMGYSTDSIKALKTYHACQENTIKLRKALCNKYQDIENKIAELNS